MIKSIFWAFIRRLKRDDISAYAAQIAFFSMLSILPFIVLVGMFLTQSGIINLQAGLELIQQTVNLPAEFVALVETATTGLDGSIAIFSFNAILVIWSASRLIRSITAGIHMAYRERDNHSLVVRYLLSFLYTILISIGVVLMIILILYGRNVQNILIGLGADTDVWESIWVFARFVLPVIILFLLFLSLYRILPARKVHFRDVYPGAIFSTVALYAFTILFVLITNLIGDYSAFYGGLSNVVILLFWFWVFGYALMIGMELNAVIYEQREEKRF